MYEAYRQKKNYDRKQSQHTSEISPEKCSALRAVTKDGNEKKEGMMAQRCVRK